MAACEPFIVGTGGWEHPPSLALSNSHMLLVHQIHLLPIFLLHHFQFTLLSPPLFSLFLIIKPKR